MKQYSKEQSMSIWEAFGMGRHKGFSREAGLLLDEAVELAGSMGCARADTGHLLLAMLQTDRGPAGRFLAGKNITEPAVRRQLAEGRTSPARQLDRKALAPDLRRAMDYALIGAQNAHLPKAEPEHLLCAMLEDTDCAAGVLLALLGLLAPASAFFFPLLSLWASVGLFVLALCALRVAGAELDFFHKAVVFGIWAVAVVNFYWKLSSRSIV